MIQPDKTIEVDHLTLQITALEEIDCEL